MTPWIPTFTRKPIQLGALTPQQVDPKDLAHHLSLLARFTGATMRLYSVAEHSYRVFELVALNGAPRKVQLQALLHDAPEAYLGDVSAPLKRLIGPEYQKLHDQAWAAICERFDLEVDLHQTVRAADVVMLATEARDLMDARPIDLGKPNEPSVKGWGLEGVQPLEKNLTGCWSPASAEHVFIETLKDLCEAE